MCASINDFIDDVVGVPNDAILYRRAGWNKIGGKERYEPGEYGRLSGNLFSDYNEQKARELGYPGPCMSVGAGYLLDAKGDGYQSMLAGFPDQGLVAVSAGDLRALKNADDDLFPQGIMLAPTDAEPWHTVVFDQTKRPRAKRVRDLIADAAWWVVPLIAD